MKNSQLTAWQAVKATINRDYRSTDGAALACG